MATVRWIVEEPKHPVGVGAAGDTATDRFWSTPTLLLVATLSVVGGALAMHLSMKKEKTRR